MINNMSIFLCTLIITLVKGQVCTSGNTMGEFGNCIANGMKTPTGQTGPISPEAACFSLKDIPWQYLNCVCAKEKIVVQCYEQFCPTDFAYSAYRGAQASYCSAAEANPVPPGSTVPGSGPATAKPQPSTLAVLATATNSNPSPTSSPSNSAFSMEFNGFAIFTTVMIFLENLL
ncbi:hypothetical protein BC833DRAFT_651892 [Globomyces pollinis-pini]|nr:hypothetical protein BC833DRAFT_651892 [Globomyces pollinis-pini]